MGWDANSAPRCAGSGEPSISQPDAARLTARERLLALCLIQGLLHTRAAQLGEGDKVPEGSQGGETYFKWLEAPPNGLGLKARECLLLLITPVLQQGA